MCGLAGIYDPHSPPTRALLEAMALPLIKRGPDAAGTLLHGPLGLIHRRLAVIDLATGVQPLYNEDRTLALLFNGEIYDYQPLRARLQAQGHVFTTQTDSEVLLHLYEQHGPAMVEQLNGMYALAICHLDSPKIFLARDRCGKKPLYYATVGQRLAFASGPRSLAVLPWVDRELDEAALADYLVLQCLPSPRSIYRGVQRLPPGYHAMWDGQELRLTRYWQPELRPSFTGSYPEAVAELRQRLTGAVRRRLVADVPLGLFLSGGLDSSLICALAQAQGGVRHQTYNIGFPEAAYDERTHAASVAQALGTEHHFLEVTADDLGHLRRIVGDFEEPFADSSMLPSSLLCQFARRQVTVALSGDGADELFGGYYRTRAMHLARHLNLLPAGLRRGLFALGDRVLPAGHEERGWAGKARRLLALLPDQGLGRYERLISRAPLAWRQRLYGPRLAPFLATAQPLGAWGQRFDASRRPVVNGLLEMELRGYLVDDILVKVDRSSMAHSLEVRSPYLDREVVEFALTLPYEFKQRGGQRKRILHDAGAGLLPAAIYARPKMGFGVPVAKWLRGPWRALAHELLLGGHFAANGCFHRPALADLLAEHDQAHADHSYPIFALMVLNLWWQQHAP